jgi:arylsulfatase A-like enzyme
MTATTAEAGSTALPAARPSNVLMVVTDQLRRDVVGAYGSPICRTPSLDRLAAGGARFDACLAPAAICSPSRASLLTGRYPHGHGILNNTHEPDALRTELPAGIPTFSELLRDAGYRLGHVGKWHIGRRGAADLGFTDVHSNPDRFTVMGAEPIADTDQPLVEPIYAQFPHGRLLAGGIDPRPTEETATHRHVDAAISCLESYAAGDAPFLLRLDLEGPHHPYSPPEAYAGLYEPASIPPWPNWIDDLDGKPAAQRRSMDHHGVEGWSWEDWQPLVARYFGYVTFIDAEIGRLLDAVDRLGLTDDLVVILTTDHGDMTGSHGGQFNKGPMMYDEIYRIPLLVRAPGIGPAGTCRTPVTSLALMPTILELAGVARPPGLHADSLVPMLVDPESQPADGAAFAEYHGDEWGLYSQRMVRTPRAKLVYSPHGSDELYDLDDDPAELVNRHDDPALASVRRDLERRLLDWMVRTDDPLALWARHVL